LLQRIGRLHRHVRAGRPAGFEIPSVRVLVPEDRDLGERIRPRGAASGPHGLGTVYEDLRTLEATWRLLEGHRRLEIPRDNRLLVERATHPEALQAVVEELGGAWVRHREHLLGGDTAERRLAELNRLRRDRGFLDGVLFPEGDERRRIPTRLGEEDRRVQFEEPFQSPFGEWVSELTLPAHLVADGTPADAAAAEDVRCAESCVRFRFGPRSYVYDRWGLRPEESDD
jgi:CRISPR-associated endonuclease/helicase Cas3